LAEATWPGRPGFARMLLAAIGSLLTLGGTLGVVLELHLRERLVQGAALWQGLLATGQLSALENPVGWNPPAWFQLAWLVWGLGILLLLLAAGRRPGVAPLPRRPFSWRDGLALLLLAGVVLLGYLLRARSLLPLADGRIPSSHYDEMVYLEDTVLWRQGLHPYSDFLLAHPPGILYALWPAAQAGEPWGGPAVLGAGRVWQCIFGLATVALLYFVAREIGGRRGGLLAALVLAVDVQVVQVAPLETVANLATVAALGLYLAAWKVARPWLRYLLLALAGGAATWAALTKAPAAVVLLLLALLSLLAWRWKDLLAGAVGAAATALAMAGPLVFRAPGAFFRQVVAFQMLRPQETAYARDHLVRMADYPDSRLTFLLLAAAVLLLALAALVEAWRSLARRRGCRAPAGPGGWALPLAVAVLVLLLLFSYGRAYHSRYYIQLVVPFALLVAAGLGAVWSRVRGWPLGGRLLAAIVAVGWLVFCLPYLAQQRSSGEAVEYDGTYGPVGQALREAVPAEKAVLALDPGFPLMAGRPPAALPDGTFLVDGAGVMVYRSLGIAGMGLGQVWVAAQESSREIDPKTVFHQPAAQDLVVSALPQAGAAVLDMRIAAEDLTPQTQEFLKSRGRQIAREQYTEAYLVERTSFLARSGCGLALWDLNVRPLSPEGREGPAAPPGEALEVPLGWVAQVSLYWYVEQTPAAPLKVSLELRDRSGAVVARLWEAPHFGEPPADVWTAGWVYQDHHNLPVSPDLRPGEYTLTVALLDASSARPWPWENGSPADAAWPVGVVRLVR
jgi:hypothetical protein